MSTFEFKWPVKPNITKVELFGSFNDWQEGYTMKISEDKCCCSKGKCWAIYLRLSFGQYQYKYKINDNWEINPFQKTIISDIGTVNNYLCIEPWQKRFKNKNDVEWFNKLPANFSLFEPYFMNYNEYLFKECEVKSPPNKSVEPFYFYPDGQTFRFENMSFKFCFKLDNDYDTHTISNTGTEYCTRAISSTGTEYYSCDFYPHGNHARCDICYNCYPEEVYDWNFTVLIGYFNRSKAVFLNIPTGLIVSDSGFDMGEVIANSIEKFIENLVQLTDKIHS